MDKTQQSGINDSVGPQGSAGTPRLGRTQFIITMLGAVGFIAGIVAVFISSNHAGTVALLLASALFLLLGLTGVIPSPWKQLFDPIKTAGASKYGPYIKWEPYAYWTKATLQMLISIIAIGFLLVRLVGHSLSTPEDIFALISYALAAAAVVELAYALFTPGPDEALDPITLGLSALLLLQFARVEEFDYKEAIAALLYVLALGLLFGIRQWWSKADELEELRSIRARAESKDPS
jgi:hypothetical protein